MSAARHAQVVAGSWQMLTGERRIFIPRREIVILGDTDQLVQLQDYEHLSAVFDGRGFCIGWTSETKPTTKERT